MNEYRRFVAYLYEYLNDEKKTTRGFVKVESKSGRCYLDFRMNGMRSVLGHYQIRCFVRHGGEIEQIPLGEWPLVQDNARMCLETDSLHMGGSSYTLDEIAGVLLVHEDGNRYYGTCWDEHDIIRLRPNADKKGTYTCTAEVEESEEKKTKSSAVYSETEDETIQHEADKTIRPEENREDSLQGEPIQPDSGNEDGEEEPAQRSMTPDDAYAQREERAEPLDWEALQERYPHDDTFSDGTIIECIRISPKDLSYLQEQDWILGNNTFLLHAYYSYRHLILGRLAGSSTYVLGVPGTYDHQEQFMAKLFGFPHFKAQKSEQMRMGQFGYWYREIN